MGVLEVGMHASLPFYRAEASEDKGDRQCLRGAFALKDPDIIVSPDGRQFSVSGYPRRADFRRWLFVGGGAEF